jgi:hypothetical protein
MFGTTLKALLFLATGIQACTNFEGDKIPFVLELPVFETTPEEINAAAALAVEGMEAALGDILSFVAVVNVTTSAAQEKQSTSFDDSPLAILERSLSETTDVFSRFYVITMVFEQEDMINGCKCSTTTQIFFRTQICTKCSRTFVTLTQSVGV